MELGRIGWQTVAGVALALAACTSAAHRAGAPAPSSAGESAAKPAQESAPTPTNAEPAASESAAAAQESAPTSTSGETTTGDGTAAAPSADSDAAPAAKSQSWVHGSSQTRFVQRWSGSDSDVDLYELLSLDFGDETKDRWTGHATARLAWDVDGTSSSSFFSLSDSRNGPVDFDLYDAYAEMHGSGTFERIRLGRQLVYDTPVALWFDGAWAQTKPRGKAQWSTGLYGGVPVHAYETSRDGDWLAGAFEEVRPTRALRLRGDYVHLQDETDFADHSNDLFALGAFHDEGGRLRWDAHYSSLDGRNRDAALGASWLDGPRDFSMQVNFYRLLEKQESLALEIDPFFDTLMTLFPYDETRVSATKGFGEHLRVLGGIDFRRVLDGNDVGVYNHDFDRYFATLTLDHALPGELTLALTAESWDDAESDYKTWGADLSRRWGKTFDASIGSFYALFKFDPFNGSERDDVRTYYATVRWHASDSHTFQLRYEHEAEDGNSGLDDFDSLRWGLLWNF
jgi:hypothetical protein